MAMSASRAHKHFLLDPRKIRKAQKLLGTKTETETVERALEEVITERERNHLAWQAFERFVRSGAVIHDVTGALDGK